MSVVDKSVYHYPVLMELTTIPDTHFQLPDGYKMVFGDEKYLEQWIQLNVKLQQMDSYQEGKNYVENTFLPNLEQVRKQMLLIVDQKDKVVGTSSIWEGYHYGEKRMRIHWVGVAEEHQCKGLAKALVLACIQLYLDLHLEKPLYLSSQTNSYIAIGMYEKLGFTPYRGCCPETFHVNKTTYGVDNEKAWEWIHQKLKTLSK